MSESRIAIALSVAALVASIVGLVISQKTANIAHAQVIPFPRVVQATFAGNVQTDPTADPWSRTIILAVTVDHMGVKINQIAIRPELIALPGQEGLKACFDQLNGIPFTEPVEDEEIVPGRHHVFSALIKFPQNCKGQWIFVGEVTFKGMDDSGYPYEQSDMFRVQAPLNLP